MSADSEPRTIEPRVPANWRMEPVGGNEGTRGDFTFAGRKRVYAAVADDRVTDVHRGPYVDTGFRRGIKQRGIEGQPGNAKAREWGFNDMPACPEANAGKAG